MQVVQFIIASIPGVLIAIFGSLAISAYFDGRRAKAIRQHVIEQADIIRTFYVPLLEHQAQRDPEVTESCELMIADLTVKARGLDWLANDLAPRRERLRGAAAPLPPKVD